MMHNWRKLTFLLFAVMVVGVATLAATFTANAQFNRESRENALRSTVLIYTLDNNYNVIASGSGSVLDTKGQVLTNFHVVGDPDTARFYNDDGILVIAMTTNVRKPAVPLYFAQVVNSDAELDLALLTIVADIDGNDLTGCLQLPTYEIGDSEELFPGDDVAVIGFPGIGGQTVTFTTGKISGFDDDPAAGGPWLKTDAEINPGNSGGSAIDTNGLLVGIPTAGIIDPDSAGKIGLLRPINAADSVIAGVSGLGVPGCTGGSTTPITPSTPPINSNGTQVILNFQGFSLDSDADEYVTFADSGITKIYANIEYIGAKTSTPLTAEWFVNGQLLEGSSLSFDTWPLDAGDGSAWINTSNPNGLEDGVYTIQIQAGDSTLTSPEITIGGGSNVPASKSVSVIGRVLSADTGRPVADALFVVLAPGITWDAFDSSNPDHLLDIAFTDSKGNFQTNVTLPLNQVYALGVLADGFEPLLADEVDLSEFAQGNIADFGDIGIKAE